MAKAAINGASNGKSFESRIWDAACSIRGAQDAPKYKGFILPLIFAKRLCDVFDAAAALRAGGTGSRSQTHCKPHWRSSTACNSSLVTSATSHRRGSRS